MSNFDNKLLGMSVTHIIWNMFCLTIFIASQHFIQTHSSIRSAVHAIYFDFCVAKHFQFVAFFAMCVCVCVLSLFSFIVHAHI